MREQAGVSFSGVSPSLFQKRRPGGKKAKRNHTPGEPNVEIIRKKWFEDAGSKANMALNWFEARHVRRSEGHNVIARAAYNARERLVDERTGQVYDYRHLGEVEWKGIFDPDDAPDWISERERLWNAVEVKEDQSTRPDDARLARDFKMALPAEFNSEQRQALTSAYAEEMSRKGMVVDVAIHAPHTHNDERNYHVHMLLTTRAIGPEGFGYKVRQWNEKEEFNHWKARWSELGADHLERAGFKKEADKFRDGHLSRRERARRAHERGDRWYFNVLLNEPEKHRGPAVSRMEREGKRTRLGDKNREIQERNRIRGVPREIREAYYLSADPKAFSSALENKHMTIARITEKDAANKTLEYFNSDRYVPRYDVGTYVAVTERGDEYRLGPMTMGDSAKGIAEFMDATPRRNWLSLEDAKAEMKRRSLIPHVDRDSVIEKLTQKTVVRVIPIADLPSHEQLQYDHEDRLFGYADKTVTQPNSHPRTDLPFGAEHLRLRAEPQVFWAYNSVKSAEDFHRSLEGRGFILARVTAEDADRSKTENQSSIRVGRYYPILKEGDYLAVGETGRIYRFNDQTLGHELREIKAFMGQLDSKVLPSLQEAKKAVEEKRQKEMMANENGKTGPKDSKDRDSISIRRGVSATVRMAAVVFEFVSNGFESLFGRSASPEERMLAEVTRHEALKANQAELRRRDHDRGR